MSILFSILCESRYELHLLQLMGCYRLRPIRLLYNTEYTVILGAFPSLSIFLHSIHGDISLCFSIKFLQYFVHYRVCPKPKNFISGRFLQELKMYIFTNVGQHYCTRTILQSVQCTILIVYSTLLFVFTNINITISYFSFIVLMNYFVHFGSLIDQLLCLNKFIM